ncbi:MAG: YicC/YloC family endoribonuclease, partial [Pseudomonadota bacterium]
PKTLQPVEDEIKSQIAARIMRGRAEVTIQLEKSEGGAAEYDLDINIPLIQSYLEIFKQLHEKFGLSAEIRSDELCKMKDVILVKPLDLNLDEISGGLRKALSDALDSHDSMRIQEGTAIETDVLKRLGLIGRYLKDIEERAPYVVADYRKRLLEKVQSVADEIKMDENRLLQEVAYFADRCDITEETVRAFSHLDQFRRYMLMGEPVGRRLDFLLQEISREANTIGSKASDAPISAKAVEIKAELEKIREQIQNVE